MNPILIASAVIPAVVLLKMVNKYDKLEKESPRLLIKLVIAGIISTALALVTETIGQYIMDALLAPNSTLYNFLLYFVVVACSEEGFKFLVLKRRTWKSPEFNCTFDGVVYSVFVSLGFALWENIKYVAMYGLGTALLRAVTAVPGHASFGVFMGVFYGMAKRAENEGNMRMKRTYIRLSLYFPILMHGAYDFIANYSDTVGTLIFFAFVVCMFILAFSMLKRASKKDEFISEEMSEDIPPTNTNTDYNYIYKPWDNQK